ncbi:hypothetical protein NZD89_17820 [Alicyclobacillus fastidiosus]|uniref:Uncharacterized protein n=1 Tax=Alicyclobacillus fastidiosus TaxID=392011 RepID=A0ABY6ZBW7_9BACL|nr:hypothetical protein [Alicyclobacillus fastidiosus]WAH40225.1 hypothetical protein NZD89_17820 [Alicyclobacillus fastidiosus]
MIQRAQDPIGNPFLWSLIPIAMYVTFFGIVVGARAVERANEKEAHCDC